MQLSLKLLLKSVLGRTIGLEYCSDCGKRNKARYKYSNHDGDEECCYKCECGAWWHTADHQGQ